MKREEFERAALGLLARNGEMSGMEILTCLTFGVPDPRQVTEKDWEKLCYEEMYGNPKPKRAVHGGEVYCGLERLRFHGEVTMRLVDTGHPSGRGKAYWALADDEGGGKRIRLAARRPEAQGSFGELLPQPS